ncbi:MAG: type II toxin-antitoxin system VapC family toxin [Tepidiformaceae bacterium]
MRALLDTNAFIWMTAAPERLTPTARAILADASNELYLSPVSVVEMSIKASNRRLEIPRDFAGFLRTVRLTWSIETLVITEAHAVGVRSLPRHHRDPFDRILIAQAIAEDLTVVTSDRAFRQYPVDVLW